MGKKFGKLMKSISSAMDSLTQTEIAELEKNGILTVDVEGQKVTVESADVDVISEDIPGWLVSNEGNLTVALEVELTEELKNEGMARELINRIQNLRKDNGLEITDRINVFISPSPSINQAIQGFVDYIKVQVLANSVILEDNNGTEMDIDGVKTTIKVEIV